MQRRLSWILGVGDIILDVWKQNKDINLKKLLPLIQMHNIDEVSKLNEQIDDMHCLNAFES